MGKVRQGLYDFTIPNEKIVEMNFDEKLVVLGLENEAIFKYENGESSKVAEYIEKGGSLIAKGIDLGSFWLAIGIEKSGNVIKKNIKPLDKKKSIDPVEEKVPAVNPHWKETREDLQKAARVISGVAENTFSFVIDKSIGNGMRSKNPALKSAARVSLKIDSLGDAGAHLLNTTTNTT